MDTPLRPHIGHHIIATIAVKKLLLGWDGDKQMPIWSVDAPAEIMRAILDFADEPAEEETPASHTTN